MIDGIMLMIGVMSLQELKLSTVKTRFDTDGKQVKGAFDNRMVVAHTTMNTGNKLVSTFFTSGDNNWYYADAKGEVLRRTRSTTMTNW
ncbi:MAG: hypothetical protein ACLTNP_03525 [Streptococcus salivarius]